MIHLAIPSVPPSTNHAYETHARRVKTGKSFQTHFIRRLSEAGNAYKTETTTHLSRTYPQELQYFVKNKPYALFICLVFANEVTLLNKGYPVKTNARYKTLDVSNRVKLLEDSLASATGVDDAHNWLLTLMKKTGKKDMTHIWAWNMEENPGPFTNVAESLLSIAEVQ